MPCRGSRVVSAPWLCAALSTLQGAGKMMTLGAAWGIRGAGGVTGPLHGTGRPGTFLELLSPCRTGV